MATPRDARTLTWARLEREIQSREGKKDRSFRLRGRWKRFVRVQDGFRLFAVDGEWVRNNLSVIFGHGGHGYVHEFIPRGEIWVATRHYSGGPITSCNCAVRTRGQKVSSACFDSTALHEIVECREMARGQAYWTAHHLADRAERMAGFLRDPYDDR